MRVFVAGATGVLGRRVVEQLAERGHEVVGLHRDPDDAALVEARGGEPHRGDVLEPETLRPAVEGADAVVNAATSIPSDPTADREDWAQNHRVRREGTANLLAVAADAGVDRYVNESVVWLARPEGGGEFGVDAPRNPTHVTESAADAERAVLEDDHPFRTTVVRSGWFYGPDGVHTQTMAEQLLARRLPILGTGLLGRESARLSFVRPEDAAAAVVAVLEHDVDGIVHAVDDEPVAYGTFLREFADLLDAPSPVQLPGWLLRPLVGRQLVQFVTTETVTSNERLRETTDWEPTYPTFREGLEDVVRTWADAGVFDGDDAPNWDALEDGAGASGDGGERRTRSAGD